MNAPQWIATHGGPVLTVVGSRTVRRCGAWVDDIAQMTIGAPTTSPLAGAPLAARPRLSSRWVEGRLVDRTSHETLNEDSHEASDASGVELAVDVTYPTLELSERDPLARVPPPKSPDDLGDLLVVHRLDL
jgi:hypothetical protein